jgi:predicted ATPase
MNSQKSKSKSKLLGIFLESFQSILNPTYINLENLTLFYGPNSAGKSSIIDALHLLKSIVDKNESNYSVKSHISKNSNIKKPAIGIEFFVGTLDDIYDNEVKKWCDTRDSIQDYSHLFFWDKLIGNKVQVEFLGDELEILRVKTNGMNLFEITGYGTTIYDEFHKYSDDYESYDGNIIYGRLKVYKNNPFFKYIDYHISDFYSQGTLERLNEKNTIKSIHSNYHYDLFIDDQIDSIEIRGIEFEAERFHHAYLVEIGLGVTEVLLKKHDRASYLKMPNFEDTEEMRFLFNHFDPSSSNYEKLKSDRRAIYDGLENISHDFSLIVQGLYFHIKDALNISHVKGDRNVYNSKIPFSAPREFKYDKLINLSSNYDHCENYAKFLGNKLQEKEEAKISYKDDFVNYCFKKYFISLNNYKVIAAIQKIEVDENKEINISEYDNKLVYLFVKNKQLRLGFEDIGSGISYIFPILTSLWESKLSFVEQPELHLHPKAQCEFGDVFISAFNKGNISVIESHSEHIILRILRRIKETTNDILIPKELKIQCSEVSIYYFEPQPEGHTEVKRIRIDRHGELMDVWPNGFFSERDSELFL